MFQLRLSLELRERERGGKMNWYLFAYSRFAYSHFAYYKPKSGDLRYIHNYPSPFDVSFGERKIKFTEIQLGN